MLLLALPVFLIAGWSISAWALAAVLWLASQGLGVLLGHLGSAWISSPPRESSLRDDVPRDRGRWSCWSWSPLGRASSRLGAALLYALAYTLESASRSPPIRRPGACGAPPRGRPVLAAPAAALAETSTRRTEFELHPWVKIKLGPLDLSINKAVAYPGSARVLTILLGISSCASVWRDARPAADVRRAAVRSRADADRRAGPADEAIGRAGSRTSRR